jgi:hypothetical protein
MQNLRASATKYPRSCDATLPRLGSRVRIPSPAPIFLKEIKLLKTVCGTVFAYTGLETRRCKLLVSDRAEAGGCDSVHSAAVVRHRAVLAAPSAGCPGPPEFESIRMPVPAPLTSRQFGRFGLAREKSVSGAELSANRSSHNFGVS